MLSKVRSLMHALIGVPIHLERMTAQLESIEKRLAKQPPPQFHIAPPDIHVAAPSVNVAPPAVHIDIPVDPYQEPNTPKSLFKALSNEALRRSVAIVERDMPEALIFQEYDPFLRHCLDRAGNEGAYCEFGVFSGKTINFIAEYKPEILIDGFDSFRGLPEEWSGYAAFDFNRNGNQPTVRDNVRLHPGWFDKTIPIYRETIQGISFLHVDCDIYSSAACIFNGLGDRLRAGAVILFDEYFCYPGFEGHEYKAFNEFLERSGRKAHWFACCGQCAACVIE